jgi:hypothetical protein
MDCNVNFVVCIDDDEIGLSNDNVILPRLRLRSKCTKLGETVSATNDAGIRDKSEPRVAAFTALTALPKTSLMKIVEIYSFHLKRFLEETTDNFATIFISILEESLNKYVSRGNILKSKTIQQFIDKNKTPNKLLDEFINLIEELAECKGFELSFRQCGYRGKTVEYALIDDNHDVDKNGNIVLKFKQVNEFIDNAIK